MSVDFKLIGQRIQAARKAKRITQEMIAEKLFVSVGYISQIERGITKVNLETLSEICAILACDPGTILSGTGGGTQTYLEAEFVEKFKKLNEKQRKAVIVLMDALSDN